MKRPTLRAFKCRAGVHREFTPYGWPHLRVCADCRRIRRIVDARFCERCGNEKSLDQSCSCFDNNCQ